MAKHTPRAKRANARAKRANARGAKRATAPAFLGISRDLVAKLLNTDNDTYLIHQNLLQQAKCLFALRIPAVVHEDHIIASEHSEYHMVAPFTDRGACALASLALFIHSQQKTIVFCSRLIHSLARTRFARRSLFIRSLVLASLVAVYSFARLLVCFCLHSIVATQSSRSVASRHPRPCQPRRNIFQYYKQHRTLRQRSGVQMVSRLVRTCV